MTNTIILFGGSITILFVIGLISIRLVIILVTVESNSMLPVLRPGDRAIVLRYWPMKWLKKGDIVVAWPPFSKEERSLSRKVNELLPAVKRVVGLPHEIIVLSNRNQVEISNSKGSVPTILNHEIQNIPPGFFFFVAIIIQRALIREAGGLFLMRIL